MGQVLGAIRRVAYVLAFAFSINLSCLTGGARFADSEPRPAGHQ
jgi:hypothetical protein